MTSTPLKRNKNLVLLSHDHHDGLMIVWKIRQGFRFLISNTRIADFVVNAFATHLQPHFIEEEQLLFVKLLQDDKLRIQAEGEHAAIRNKVAALQPTSQATAEDLEEFAKLLEEHIRFEERVLFPYIEQQINDGDLEKIGATLKLQHTNKCAFTWEDKFWINTKA
jgi:iron-sulfur cluster repair protein YtfE (RIC family)